MRIIGGKHRGRVLTTPKGDIVRPTSDKVRAALFNILTHGVAGFDLEGACVLH
ncbi:MAG: RsmD family RNA methyltransferase [Pseudomonadota bacterium]